MTARVDPGYGSAIAPKGTEEWAKNWRLAFQGIAKELPEQPQRAIRYYKVGLEYEAWKLLTDSTGKAFGSWDEFCACPQPWGLGVVPDQFNAYLKAEMGERAFGLLTVAPDMRRENGVNQHTGPKVDSSDSRTNPPERSGHDKAAKLRAILRAPEIVQDLYRQGKVSQITAAKLGPKSPTPEQAAKVAEARQGIERLDLSKPAKEVRKAVDKVVRETVGLPTPTALDAAKKACAKLTAAEWRQLVQWMGQQRQQAG